MSLYEKLFLPEHLRDRSKEAEAEMRFRKTSPPCLNGSAPGFVPGFFSRNLLLCPANWEYGLADILVPFFYKIGIDTPNKVTLLNCVVVRLTCLYWLSYAGDEEHGGQGRWIYWLLCLFMPMQQMVDCADGQMARRYGLGSDFGAWLDHTTDYVFGASVSYTHLTLPTKRIV